MENVSLVNSFSNEKLVKLENDNSFSSEKLFNCPKEVAHGLLVKIIFLKLRVHIGGRFSII